MAPPRSADPAAWSAWLEAAVAEARLQPQLAVALSQQLVAALVAADPDGPLPPLLAKALGLLGDAALTALLETYQQLDEGIGRGQVADVLAALGRRDSRVLALLTARLAFEPGLAAEALAGYGDPAALPALRAALAAELAALEDPVQDAPVPDAPGPDEPGFDDALALLDAIATLGDSSPADGALWDLLLDRRDAATKATTQGN